jgi:hypothetical protein
MALTTGNVKRRRVLKAVMADGDARRDMMVDNIVATQAREGIHTTREQAEEAYRRVQNEKEKPNDQPRGYAQTGSRHVAGPGARSSPTR